tara:strand:+ start:89 stop:937 length:849 start_codon:yes stop_codon:yes gene_type:complete
MSNHTAVVGHVFRGKPYNANSERYIRLASDYHLGSSATNEDDIIRELKDAQELDARINLFGDITDGILPKDFKRYTPSALIKALSNRDDILNATVDHMVAFLEPYAPQIDVLGSGNHEEAILKHHSFNILAMVIRILNMKKGVDIKLGGYTGYITYRYENQAGGRTMSLVIYYHHGFGGSAPKTKGVLDFSKTSDCYEGYDVVAMGHKHTMASIPDVKVTIDKNGQPVFRDVFYVRTGAYMDYTKDSYAISKGYNPAPHGGALIRTRFRRKGKQVNVIQGAV